MILQNCDCQVNLEVSSDDYNVTLDVVEEVTPLINLDVSEDTDLINLTLIEESLPSVELSIEDLFLIDLTVEEGTFIEGSGLPYSGPYEVVPMVKPQTLPTKTKLMKEDVTVLEIPKFEFSNLYGTTIVIGGIANGY